MGVLFVPPVCLRVGSDAVRFTGPERCSLLFPGYSLFPVDRAAAARHERRVGVPFVFRVGVPFVFLCVCGCPFCAGVLCPAGVAFVFRVFVVRITWLNVTDFRWHLD